ncbi:MAG: carbohydrate ABC transporter permease [Chthonomonas sp.]|nr:carbohydrate ABC transporter permease [Chthonomonas sp.]
MSAEMLFALSTLAGWAAWFFVVMAVLAGLRLAANAPGIDRDSAKRSLVVCSVGALLGFLVCFFTPADLGRQIEGEGVRIPAVWFYMHFWGWAALSGAVMGLTSLIQGYLAVSQEERTNKLKWMGGWLIFAGASFWLFKWIAPQVTIFRGAFFLSPATIGIAALLLFGSLAFLAFSTRRATTRSAGKTMWTHLALLAGCAIFGLPFAWLLSSSFKEDRDLTGGVMWIPKVTETTAYFDPNKPQFSGQAYGMEVTAEPTKDLGNGKFQFDIVAPFNMRGRTFEAAKSELKVVPKQVPIVNGDWDGTKFRGRVIEELGNGDRRIEAMEPANLAGQVRDFKRDQAPDSRPDGLRWKNYPEALQYLPPETNFGLVYLKNTLILVVLSVIGTILSCAIVAYAFSRMRFPGREFLFKVLLATMMLPGAVTLMPQFLIFKNLGWIDTLQPLWVPAFFAGAFNVFMLRQFFNQIPMELEDAAKIDGCSFLRSFWTVMLPQVKPALAVIAIWTFMGTWNNFMGPLIYINSPENMPIAYALQLFSGERSGEPGLLMAFATMTMLPVLALFFFAQKYFIEGVTLSGLGGR